VNDRLIIGLRNDEKILCIPSDAGDGRVISRADNVKVGPQRDLGSREIEGTKYKRDWNRVCAWVKRT